MAFNAFDNFVEIQKLKKELSAKSGQIAEHNTSETAHEGMFAPMYSYGTTDLTAGTSALETGKIHLVYE